ncbi:amino acid/polyamine transporter I [Dactylonectria estremocensis]|uniref:Amino acid/polyamine transporter I n=1 Tax=Dactylonectria estremocensis TaxID=1079267 RepID=A0A9P9DSG4_9HYPO|nr:amino acid/polyamine transporter I [Dactylonectria estremocensis]
MDHQNLEKGEKSDMPARDVVNKADSVAMGELGDQNDISPDAAKLIAMGYKPQMKRQMSTLQLVGVAFMVTASWLGVTGGFSIGVVIGGSASLVYGLIIVAVINIFIVTALSELVSAMPNAGGQYYWVTKLAPQKLARVSAYFTGICNLSGGILASAGATVLMGHMVLGVAKLAHPDYVIQQWHAWMIGVAFNVSTCAANINRENAARSVSIGMFFNILICAAIVVVIPAVSTSHTDASFIFASVENISGWNNGVSFLVGLINANYSFGLIDTAVHMCEEITEPEKNVPKALFLTVAIGFFTAWPLAVLLMYCMTDFEAIVNTETGLPLLELFYLALRQSKAAAIVMFVMLIIAWTFALVALHNYQSRICWSFARDNGLPFSKFWSKVHPTLNVPLEALVGCTTLSAIVSLLCVASSTAFNSLAAGVIIFPALTYTMPSAYSLLPRNKDVKGPFNAGVFGTISKVVTILFSLFATIIYSFPNFMPATGSNMNYVSAIIATILIGASFDWLFRARCNCQEPVARAGLLIELSISRARLMSGVVHNCFS